MRRISSFNKGTKKSPTNYWNPPHYQLFYTQSNSKWTMVLNNKRWKLYSASTNSIFLVFQLWRNILLFVSFFSFFILLQNFNAIFEKKKTMNTRHDTLIEAESLPLFPFFLALCLFLSLSVCRSLSIFFFFFLSFAYLMYSNNTDITIEISPHSSMLIVRMKRTCHHTWAFSLALTIFLSVFSLFIFFFLLI